MKYKRSYTLIDMLQIAKLARENLDIKACELVKIYCADRSEISDSDKRDNAIKWLRNNNLLGDNKTE